MRSALIISITLHLVITLIAVQWVSFREVKFVPRQVYAVDIVTAEQIEKKKQKEESPPPKVEEQPKVEPEPQPKEEEEMPPPPTKPKTRKKPKPKKTRTVPTTQIEKTKPEEEPAEDAQSEAPETGDISFDADDFPYAHYIGRIRRKIAAQWRVPEGSQGEDRFCVIYFRILRDGTVINTAIEQSSGLFIFDQAAQRAVVQASPMPPLPQEYRDDYLGVHFSFSYREER